MLHLSEVFFSLQGEGARVGIPSVFVRFAGCNLDCSIQSHGFDCDTDYQTTETIPVRALVERIERMVPRGQLRNIVLTGGEPTLQLSDGLLSLLLIEGWFISIETNGTRIVPKAIDWITISPKVPPEQLVQREADELKIVIPENNEIPEYPVCGRNAPLQKFVQPAWYEDDHDRNLISMAWCVDLVKRSPGWRLSAQLQKSWGIR